MSDKGVEFINFLTEAKWVNANEKIASFFNIKEGEKILCLSRLRGFTDGPFVYFESYFHPRIGLTGKENFKKPLYSILENDLHVVPSISKEEIRARLASKITADRLQIKKGDPILVRERFVSDPGHRPLEYNIGFYIAEKFTYSITITR